MELFRTFDRQGRARDLVARAEVHRRGLWHKSAHVFLFDHHGRLLLQRRAADKDLYAGLWDYSVGEHLLDGESFHAGAMRGSAEELGVSELVLEPLGEVRFVEFVGDGFIDREIQQAFQGRHSGPVQPDPVEVAETRLVELEALAAWIDEAPGQFTPWFVSDLHEFGFIGGGDDVD